MKIERMLLGLCVCFTIQLYSARTMNVQEVVNPPRKKNIMKPFKPSTKNVSTTLKVESLSHAKVVNLKK